MAVFASGYRWVRNASQVDHVPRFGTAASTFLGITE